MNAIPVNLLTGFLGAGKTTLLQRMVAHPELSRAVVFVNELGEIGLDHLAIRELDDRAILLQSGCLCCELRGDMRDALAKLLSDQRAGTLGPFDRVLVETTGLANPLPILATLRSDQVLRHQFRRGNVVTVVDAFNAAPTSETEEWLSQVVAADCLAVTKADLCEPMTAAAVGALLRQLNPAAVLFDVNTHDFDPAQMILDDHFTSANSAALAPWIEMAGSAGGPVHLHATVESISLKLDGDVDWAEFSVWLGLLLHHWGSKVLRVKGLISVAGEPVVFNSAQHLVHPPIHLTGWPTDDHSSRMVFITAGLSAERIAESLAQLTSVRRFGSVAPARHDQHITVGAAG